MSTPHVFLQTASARRHRVTGLGENACPSTSPAALTSCLVSAIELGPDNANSCFCKNPITVTLLPGLIERMVFYLHTQMHPSLRNVANVVVPNCH